MSQSGQKRRRGHLRIIAGRWRGRKLSFTAEEGLRPTTDRVRETLFNWLAADIHGARCLDLFAGSGALGLEALSRGAAHCDFVDASKQVTRQLHSQLATLDARNLARVSAGNALEFLPTARAQWDIVFVDPPFGQGLASPACQLLQAGGLLAESALVYVETASGEAAPAVPENWGCQREKIAGGVACRLFIVTAV